jgi:hypothetical protein
MRPYLAVLTILVAATVATSAYADPVTYDFSVFSGYYFLGGSHYNAVSSLITFQVTGDTSNIVADPNYLGANELVATTAEILVNGSYYGTITDPITVVAVSSTGLFGLVDTSADIMDITSNALIGLTLASNVPELSGVASFGGSNPMIGATGGGDFELVSPDSVDFYSADVTSPGRGQGSGPGLRVSPEPSALLLLGTGLFGLAVPLFRKARAGMTINA